MPACNLFKCLLSYINKKGIYMTFLYNEPKCNIFWIYLNRFDENISKIPRLEIAQSLINSGFSVTLLTGFRRKRYLPKNYEVKIQYFRTINRGFFFKISLIFQIYIWLLKMIKKGDVIIASPDSLLIGTLLKYFSKCKLHLDIRTYPVEVHNLKTKIESIIYWYIQLKLFIKIPDSFSFITELLKKRIENDYHIKFLDYVIWHSGVNSDHFRVVRNSRKKKEGKFVLTYVGVLTENRGIDRVILAIDKLEHKYKANLIFNIIGNGFYLPNLIYLTNKLYLDHIINFLGFIPYELIPEHLKDTDCFICPLPDRPEWNISSPIKIFEYFACARPVILTPIIAHKNIVKNHKFIIWTDSDKVEAFTEAIKYAFKNKEQLLKISKIPEDIIKEDFSWKAQGIKFAKYLSSLLFTNISYAEHRRNINKKFIL